MGSGITLGDADDRRSQRERAVDLQALRSQLLHRERRAMLRPIDERDASDVQPYSLALGEPESSLGRARQQNPVLLAEVLDGRDWRRVSHPARASANRWTGRGDGVIEPGGCVEPGSPVQSALDAVESRADQSERKSAKTKLGTRCSAETLATPLQWCRQYSCDVKVR